MGFFEDIEDAAGPGYWVDRAEVNRAIGRMGYHDAESIELGNVYGKPAKRLTLLMDGRGKLQWQVV